MKKQMFAASAALTALVSAWALSPALADDATDLRGAVYYNEYDKVAEMLDRGVPVDSRAAGGFTPLMTAASNGDSKMVVLLLERGADPTLENDSGRSVLELAKLRNDYATTKLIEQALAGGDGAQRDAGSSASAGTSVAASPRQDAAAARRAPGASVKPMQLYGAVYGEEVDKVRALLAAGADPNERNTAGMTPLIAAVRYHNPVLTRMLLAAGADADLKDNYGRTARDYAKISKSPEVRAMLGVKPALSDAADRQSPNYAYCHDLYMKDYNLCGSGEASCRLSSSRHYKQCLRTGTWY